MNHAELAMRAEDLFGFIRNNACSALTVAWHIAQAHDQVAAERTRWTGKRWTAYDTLKHLASRHQNTAAGYVAGRLIERIKKGVA